MGGDDESMESSEQDVDSSSEDMGGTDAMRAQHTVHHFSRLASPAAHTSLPGVPKLLLARIATGIHTA